MDFWRRIFRGQQRDKESRPDGQPSTATSKATVADTAFSPDQAEHSDHGHDIAGQNGLPASDHALPFRNDESAWWEDTQPLVEATQAEPLPVEQGVPDVKEAMPADSTAPTEPLELQKSPPAASTNPTDQTLSGQEQSAGEAHTSDTSHEREAGGTHQLALDSAPALSVTPSQRSLAMFALRDVGRIRTINQDSVFALITTLPREGTDVPMGLFVVADGMGGHEGGEIASRLAIRTVADEIVSQLMLPALDDSLTEALQPLMIAAVQEANRVIWEQAQSVGSDMGTTCTAVLLLGRALYIAHVGDSRAYLLEAGGLRALTDDHSAVGRLIQLGQLDPSEARDHPLRSQLYRTIGQQPQIQVDFIYHWLHASSHLMLCSDGLWGMIAEEQIEQTLLRYTWPQDACRELIALANLAGGEDNISAIVVTLPDAERPL